MSSMPKMYRELVPWYRLLTPPEEYVEEAACYRDAFRAAMPSSASLLELGAGAGHNAFHLARDFRCTLTDLSPEMLALSRELNPACDHVVGDMRTLRLDQRFDAVLVHDAIMYMTSEADLAAAVRTAFEHLVPGGVALFAPDATTETFVEGTEHYSGRDGSRALECLEWCWDPDPGDSTYVVDYAFLLRDGVDVTAVHDRHVEGLFPLDTWFRILREQGFEVDRVRRPIGDGDRSGDTDEIFRGRRPMR